MKYVSFRSVYLYDLILRVSVARGWLYKGRVGAVLIERTMRGTSWTVEVVSSQLYYRSIIFSIILQYMFIYLCRKEMQSYGTYRKYNKFPCM